MTTTHRPGTLQWCEEGGRLKRRLGWLTVFMSPADIEEWNAADYRLNPLHIRCHIPTSEPDHSYVEDGEVIVFPGLPSDWYGTIGEALVAEMISGDDYEELKVSPVE